MTKARDLADIISGGFDATDIPNLDTAKITSGTFVDARLPNLDTAKITTGTFADARMPSTVLNSNVDLTNLSASNLTSGTLPDARFPSTLPAVSGANLTNLPGGGKVLQVQNFLLNAGSSATTTSTSFVDSALTDQITPSATSSKILVMVHLNGFKTDITSANTIVTVKRAISGGSTTDIGGSGTLRLAHTYEPNAITSAFNVYDSPNTTSAIDYTVQWRTDSPHGYSGQLYRGAATSTITLIEIGA